MLLGLRNDVLTRDRLIGSRWSFGKLHEPVMTEQFCFGADGLVKNYRESNEHSWTLEDGLLRLFNEAGALTWVFEIMFLAGDRLVLIAQYQNDAFWRPFFCLTELAPAPAPETQAEAVRLVIWDLDETFWRGTLSEGPVTPVLENLATVRALNERGIMSAVCSKNDFEPVKKVLRNLGIWDEFIFPEIAFAPKGPMVARIVENVQLRPESILFVDDNVTNLNEARFFVPGLQVAEPDILPGLLADARLKGKPDPEKKRLAHYKVLELKAAEKGEAAGDNERFLRASDIRVSFHHDIEAQFDRVHDLVNRTNQLNFTKNRWPEQREAALAAYYSEQSKDFNWHAGYVKVADKYGKYGICGYYFVMMGVCTHLLFSCRSMNMGVEQFVYSRLGRPEIRISGEVISDLFREVDWVRVVDDADDDFFSPAPVKEQTICIRGACDMAMASNFLRIKSRTLEELTYGWNGWEICSLPRIVALHEEVLRPENQAIIAKLPGMPPGRFETDVVAGRSDAYVLSFSQESFHGYYRSRSTGMILPMGHFSLGMYAREKPDYTKLTFAELQAANLPGIFEDEWNFFVTEFEFAGGFDQERFVSDIQKVFSLLRGHGKPVIIVGLNERIGRDTYILNFFARINAIVRPMSEASGFHYIDIGDFIHGEDDLAADGMFGGPHFARHVYARLAEAVLEILTGYTELHGV
jgi:FkbH-like protein